MLSDVALVVRGGTIVDGTGKPPFKADIRIQGDRIIEIGPDLDTTGCEEIDATGCHVAPGIIDIHTHYDAALFWDPRADPISLHGVTTILIGNCSLGLAPVRAADVDMLGSLFSYIEDLPRDLFASEIPWNWVSFPQYAATMRDRPWGVNIAALVSHSLLRQYEMGGKAWSDPASPDQARAIATTAEAAMASGAFGISTSRFDRSPAGDPVPSFHADDAELSGLFKAVASHGGLVQVIADLSDTETWIRDLRRFGEHAGRDNVPVVSNGIYQRADDPAQAAALLEAGRDMQHDGVPFYHMVSPRSIELLVSFKQSMLFIYVPAFNEVVQPSLSREEKLSMLADPQWRVRARFDWDNMKGGFPSNGAERSLRIIKVGTPANERYLGKTFDIILDARQGHPADIIADWVIENDLEAEFVHRYTNTDPEAVAELLAAPENVIGASDAGAHVGMFDGAGDSTCVLAEYVRDRKTMTIEEAIARMTGDLAQLIGLADRGIIRTGKIADLFVFDLDALHWAPEIKVTDLPNGHARFRRPPGGIRYTLIGGKIVQQDGRYLSGLHGRFLGRADRTVATGVDRSARR